MTQNVNFGPYLADEVGRHSIDRAARAPQPLANKPTGHSACTARAGKVQEKILRMFFAAVLSSVSRPMFFALIWFNTMLNLQGKTLLHWTLQNSLSLETENPRYPHFEPNTYIQI